MILHINYLQLVIAVSVGLASGYLGSFMVLKKMALVGDALSHVALPGVALAILFHVNPFLGAFCTLLIGIIGIWLIETKTELSTESLVGLFFTFSLAIGILITPHEDILEALFGDITKVTRLDAILALVFSIVIIIVMKLISKGFILSTISSDLAKSSGTKVARNNFIFLFLVALIVALGIKAVGTLLMGALVIIPAIASKNFTSSMRSYSYCAAFIGLLSLLGGILLANLFHLSPGPIVVLTSSAIFAVSIAFSK